MANPFTRHPHAVGETYAEHLRFALGMGLLMLVAGLGCLLHGLFPFLCTRTGSRALATMQARIASRGAPPPTASAALFVWSR